MHDITFGGTHRIRLIEVNDTMKNIVITKACGLNGITIEISKCVIMY